MFPTLRTARAPEESARAFVYRVLSMYIRELFLRPGEKLVETDVAHALRVSRTPVHDTFSRLIREKMLRPVPRGAMVPPLDPDAIRQLIWMYRTTTVAVLGELYNDRPASLETLEHCVADQYMALRGGSTVKMAGLERIFWTELFRLADRLPVLQALEYAGVDLYRMLRMLEDARMWRYIVDRHADLVQALAMHDHEAAVAALEAEFDLFAPLLEECRYRYPTFFELPLESSSPEIPGDGQHRKQILSSDSEGANDL